jgi:hypothetical protein
VIRISLNAIQTITDWDGTSETGSTTTGATAEWDDDDDYAYESAGGDA